MMRSNRHPLPTCEVSVSEDYGFSNSSCGLPAIAYWDWTNGEEPKLFVYVCEKHDAEIAENEESIIAFGEGK